MPFGAHETVEVHEILNEKINMINHLSLYAEQAQSQQVRSLVQQHLQSAIQHYDQLVAYTHNYSAANGIGSGMHNSFRNSGAGLGMNGISPQDIQYGLRQPAPMAPQTKGQFNDQQILCAMLCSHKCSAKNATAASLECADPNLRQMLMNGALAANQHAFEIFILMNQQGQYQVPTLQDHTAKTYLHAYQPVHAASTGFQQ